MSDTAEAVLRRTYVLMSQRVRYRPMDSGRRYKNATRMEARRYAATILRSADPAALPERLAEAVLLGESRRALMRGDVKTAADLAALALEQLSREEAA